MKTILVWILLSMQPHPHQVSELQFPNQAECLRTAQKLNQYGKYHVPYRCESIRVIDPYPTEEAAPVSELDAAAAERAKRNAEYNQHKLDELTRGH